MKNNLKQRFLLIIVLMLITAMGVLSITREEYTCSPTEDCQGAPPGSKVPDPHNCTNYYLCITSGTGGEVYPSDNAIPCPEDQFFNLTTGNCDNENGIPCKDQCVNFCQVYCQAANDLIPYPFNCSQYYYCASFDDLILIDCPAGEFFDGSGCTTNEELCCEVCSPYCSAPFTETMNPLSCYEYYICTSVGVPNPEDLYSCEDGQYFEPTVGKCIDEDPLNPCESLC